MYMLGQRRSILRLGFIVAVVCLVSLFVAPPLLTKADDPPPRPAIGTPTPAPEPPSLADLPHRPAIVTPVPASRPRPASKGAAIELNVQFLAGSPASVEWREGLWTIVQWQDGLGEWHDVYGWRATLDEVNGAEGKKVWYLAENLLGEGPYSWAVYPDPEGEFIARSAPFYMPDSTGQTRYVKVAMGPLPVTASKSKASALPPTGGSQHPGLWKFLTIGLVVLLVAQLLPRRDRWFR